MKPEQAAGEYELSDAQQARMLRKLMLFWDGQWFLKAAEAFGLEAARTYYSSLASFLPIQGDLEHPPLQAGRLSLIVCNASLHYASDLESTLQRVADALRPGGHMVILDTPIARHPRPGTGRGDRHLGRQELHSALLDAGLRPRRMAVQRGWRWRMHQVKALLRGDARFSFPMIVAERTL